MLIIAIVFLDFESVIEYCSLKSYEVTGSFKTLE